MTNVKVLGAGMAGLIAANMLRKKNVKIYEAQSSLPNNHRALLRFRTNRIGEEVGIPFRPVEVRKALVYKSQFVDPNPMACNAYSLKVTDKILGRSVWNLNKGTRYIAPEDFISKLAYNMPIEYNSVVDLDFLEKSKCPKISTIPMPVMMKITGWEQMPDFHYKHIYSMNGFIKSPEVDVYQTIYFADHNIPVYRASLCKNEIIVEMAPKGLKISDHCKERIKYEDVGIEELALDGAYLDGILELVLAYFGLDDAEFEEPVTVRRQQYGKIVPIDEELRKEFIYWLTQEYNVFSLGRFATWRQLLLDDLVDDIKTIEQLINLKGAVRNYEWRRGQAKKELERA